MAAVLDRRALLSALAAGASWPALAQPVADRPASVVAKFSIRNGRPLIPVTIGGRGPWPFLLDTGAVVSGLDAALARELGLRTTRSVTLAGGGGPFRAPLFEAADVVLGGAVRQPSMQLIGLDRGIGGGSRGILAAGVVTSVDSEFDFGAEEWRLHLGGYTRPADFVRLPGRLVSDRVVGGSPKIVVDAMLDGRPLRLMVDTGSPRGLLLDHAVAVRLGLWNGAPRFAPVRLSGAGGQEQEFARVVRADALQLGPRRFERPLVTLQGPDGLDGADWDGIVGMPLVARLDWAFAPTPDRGAIFVRANSREWPDERYGLSGIWIDPGQPGRYPVSAVGSGSPGDEAGVRRGDVILNPLAFELLLLVLNAPSAGPLPLTVERNGRRLTLPVTPRPYL